MRGCPPFLCSSALLPICMYSLYREAAGGGAERGSVAVQRYGGMKYRDGGGGGAPLPNLLDADSS